MGSSFDRSRKEKDIEAQKPEKSILVCGGASQDITGSGYLVELDGIKIQIDGGSFQGKTSLQESKNMYEKRILSQPNYTFITHSHIDHVAGLSIQAQNEGFPKNTTFITSHLTKDVLAHVLGDALKLQYLTLNKFARKAQILSHLKKRRQNLTSVVSAMIDKGYVYTNDFKESFYDEYESKSSGKKDKGRGAYKSRSKHLIRLYNHIPSNYSIQELQDEINDIDKKMEYGSGSEGDLSWLSYDEQAPKFILKNTIAKECLSPFFLQREHIVNSNIVATLYPTGHIAGSVSVLFDVLNAQTQKIDFSLMFSGDIGRKRPTPFQKGFIIPQKKIDTLVVESTYGDKNHITSYTEGLQNLAHKANQSTGPTMIFAISYQKFQEILITLLNHTTKQIYCFGKLPKEFTEIFIKNSPELFAFIQDNPRISRENYRDENDELFQDPDALFLATSGMMLANANMIARALCNNPTSTIISTNYLPQGTPGHRLKEKNEILNEDGSTFGVFKGTYYAIDGLSGHGDQSDIISYVLSLDPKVTILTHGDMVAKTELKNCLAESGYQGKVVIPNNGNQIDIVTGNIF